MNSPREFSLNGLLPDDSASSSSVSTSDNNANLSNTNQNKGAIPKTKTPKPINTSKKSTKLNNNVEDILLSKSSADLTDGVLQMHSDVLRLNGYSDQLSRISSSYLDDYNTTLFTNGSDNCENCSGRNKTNIVNLHENHFNHDIFTNASKIEENGTNDSCKVSYQPSTSTSKGLDSDINLQLKIDTESSSSEDNELLSISDDGCIYTYKGDHLADLPSSFFSLDIPPSRSPEVSPQHRLENTSPEMDFLEMDFDPGPSGDADSDSQSNADLEGTENLPQDPSFKLIQANEGSIYSDKKLHVETSNIFCKPKDSTDSTAESEAFKMSQPLNISRPSTSGMNLPSPCTSVKQDSPISTITERLRRIRMPWTCSLSQRTTSKTSNRFTKRHHSSNGELTSPSDRIPSPCEDFEKYKFNTTNDNFTTEKIMIWSEEEACRKQITQIGASACGATAVLNVLNALRFPIPSIDIIQEAVQTRLRANSSPLTEYLLSRSNAGSTHEDLIEGLEKVTDGQVYARFFHMYPERIVNLNTWLSFWISHGAVPIATLNLQKCLGTIPDAWHHQMIFGVGPRGIYLTNPLECIDAGQLWPQLSSESILLIRREDILSRWNIKTDLNQLMKIKDSRWNRMNVVGQVANMIRENKIIREKRLGFANMSHIKIPAAYSSGITLTMRLDAPLCPLLMYSPELPIVPPYDEATGYSDILTL